MQRGACAVLGNTCTTIVCVSSAIINSSFSVYKSNLCVGLIVDSMPMLFALNMSWFDGVGPPFFLRVVQTILRCHAIRMRSLRLLSLCQAEQQPLTSPGAETCTARPCHWSSRAHNPANIPWGAASSVHAYMCMRICACVYVCVYCDV